MNKCALKMANVENNFVFRFFVATYIHSCM
jgi:hypothetical protein